MTRATLLHVLDRPTALGPAEVRELEQLALAFPYCQTAHLLLAKAAHDQGTMLASQRLRRAATYAADRALLRRLIEQVEPVATVETIIEERGLEEPAAVPEPVTPPVPVALPVPVEIAAQAEAGIPEPLPKAEPVAAAPVQTPEVVLLPGVAPVVAATPEPALPVQPTAPLPIASLPEPVAVAAPAAVVAPELPVAALAIPEAQTATINADSADSAETNAELLPLEADLPVLIDQEGVQIPTDSVVPELGPETLEPTEAVVTAPEKESEIEIIAEADLPAQAPAIRPPVEAGEARFEFGLAEAPAPPRAVYELPGLVDEWAAAAVTLSLGSPEIAVAPVLQAVPDAPAFTPAAFTGDASVGYAFGESSRLGLSMQLLDLLTARAETAESATAVVAAAQPPATALPPAGTFFEPDPLLLDHWATHCPPPPALPSSLDLINNFLKRQPRLTRPGMLPPSPAAQADLSVRSTRAEPDLASETLARILVRQGKPLRAIEIYEKLMVKQPEKMAYFAAQIQSLQPPA